MCSILPDLPTDDRSSSSTAAPRKRAESTVASCQDAQFDTRAQQLRQVASRIEEFLLRQIDRLEDEIAKTANTAQDLESGALREDFERLRDKWEVERQQEIDKLREDAQRLAESWQHLEAEQRELLMRQATIRTVPVPVSHETDGYADNGAMHPVRLSPAGAVAAVGAEIRALAGGATVQKAQLQFQQLRREMQRHAQQRK